MSTQRDAARRAIRARPRFTIADLEADGIGRSTAQNVVHELVRDGAVEATAETRPGKTRGRCTVYRVVKPDVLATSTPADGRQRMWTTIRIKRLFTVNDLVAHASVSRTNATTYVHRLVRAGVVRPDGRLQPAGHPGSYRVYRLVEDAGPKPPVLPQNAPRGEVDHV